MPLVTRVVNINGRDGQTKFWMAVVETFFPLTGELWKQNMLRTSAFTLAVTSSTAQKRKRRAKKGGMTVET